MNSSLNRWLVSGLILSTFVIVGFARTHARQSPGTIPTVIVANTSAQQVPVLPPARPTTTGAYIVAINNNPSVKILSTQTTPVFTRDVDKGDQGDIQLYSGSNIQDGSLATVVLSYTVPAGKRLVLSYAAAQSQCVTAGNYADHYNFTILNSNFTHAGVVSVMMTGDRASALSAHDGPIDLFLDAGQTLEVDAVRGVFTNGLSPCFVTVRGHLIAKP